MLEGGAWRAPTQEILNDTNRKGYPPEEIINMVNFLKTFYPPFTRYDNSGNSELHTRKYEVWQILHKFKGLLSDQADIRKGLISMRKGIQAMERLNNSDSSSSPEEEKRYRGNLQCDELAFLVITASDTDVKNQCSLM